MSRTVVVAGDGLHALAHAKDEHDAKASKRVDDAIGTHSEVATIADELAVEQGHHTRGRHIHQEGTHADEQDVAEDIQLGLPGMAAETDEGAPLQEMPDGDDSRAAHGDGGGPGRTGNTPIQGIDKQGVESDVEYGTAHHDPHRLLGITRGTYQTRQVEGDGGHEHTGQHDVHILAGIGDGIGRGAEHGQDFIHEEITTRDEEEAEDESQQHTVAQDVFSPFVVLLAQHDRHTG